MTSYISLLIIIQSAVKERNSVIVKICVKFLIMLEVKKAYYAEHVNLISLFNSTENALLIILARFFD